MIITSRALAFASLWFDAATVERVFAPLVADWQREWIDAPSRRRHWILLRGALGFATAFLTMAPRVLATPIPSALLRTIVTRMFVFTVVMCGVLAVPFWLSLGDATVERRGLLLLILLPSLVAWAFSLAPSFALDRVRATPTVSHVERRVFAQVAVAAALFAFAVGGWVIPQFNRALRIETVGNHVPASARGVRELTTLELISDPTSAAAYEPYTGGRDRGTRVRAELLGRAYAVALPVLLMWLRWKALDLPREGWLPLPAVVSSVLAGAAVIILFFGTRRMQVALGLPSGASNYCRQAS